MLSHKFLKSLWENAGTRSGFDWDALYGDTFPEKYESFYVKLAEMTQILIAKGAKGYFWAVCDPIIGSLLENRVDSVEEIIPMGVNMVHFLGILAKRWRIYIDTEFKPGQILIGCTDKNEEPYEIQFQHGALSVLNLVR